MHRLFFGGCNLPNFNFNIPVIICHKTVQRNVKTIKDISKQEKIWSTQIYCLANLFVKTPLPLESMKQFLASIYSSRMPSNVIWNRRWRWCTYLTRMAMPKRLMQKMKNVNSKKYEKEMIAMMMKTFVLLGKDDARNFRCIKCEQRNHWTVLTSRFGHMEWVHK